MALIKTYGHIPFDKKEILRYAGCGAETPDVLALLDACIAECEGALSYKVCYLPLDARVKGGVCDFGVLRAVSKGLSENLKGCDKAVLFAATLGVGLDRLIAKYSAVSPAKALMMDAIGTERVEALCDRFCRDVSSDMNKFAGMRFSPGYGDLDVSFQKEIFSVLDCSKNIGLTLNDSFMMSPSKSVTAIVGMRDEACDTADKCAVCDNKECVYRGSL
ncbi:MAG: Vitamin B12 dependent methionine synthase activation subunit [Clostridia bacterium]|nr:Vitamin B12 dependent methionine synthase activation subunit [Clostridia bacterium]